MQTRTGQIIKKRTRNMSIPTPDCSEEFSSKVDEIRQDGPSIYTSILEKADNSCGWGKATEFHVTYDLSRMNMNLKDNAPNGFVSEEAVHRFFKLGGRNKDVCEKSIGKYGKGGYKGVINIGDKFVITSYFNNKKYTISTDINTMMEENNPQPTTPLQSTEYSGKMCGTEFNINLLPKYHVVLNEDDMLRNLMRAYHKMTMEITIQGKKVEKVDPYGSDFKESTGYDVFWKEGEFTCRLITDPNLESDSDHDSSDNESEDGEKYVGKLTLMVLRNMTWKYPYLSSYPGMDIYRNDRMCNSNGPIRNLGNIGMNLIGSGDMRGKKCHMIFEYGSIKLTDVLDMDNCIGLTSNKEISEESCKWDGGLLKLFEEKASECSQRYQMIVKNLIKGHLDVIQGDVKYLQGYELSCSTDVMATDSFKKVEFMYEKYSIFVTTGLCVFDEEKWVYLDGQPPNRDKIIKTKSNTKLIKEAKTAQFLSDKIIKKQTSLIENNKLRASIIDKHNLDTVNTDKFINFTKKIKAEQRVLKTSENEPDKGVHIATLKALIGACEGIIDLEGISDISEYEILVESYRGKLPLVEEEHLIAKKEADETKKIATKLEAKAKVDAEAKAKVDAEAKAKADAEAKANADVEALKAKVKVVGDEKKYDQRKGVTSKDVDSLYQNIMNDCRGDEDIQKIYKVLEYYNNNP